MPIYAYRCSNCGHQQDVLQKISDAPLTVCPECGQATYAKQLSAPAFQLKGTGWYVTDFRDNKKPGQDKAAGDGAAGKDGPGGEKAVEKGADKGGEKGGEKGREKGADGAGAKGGDRDAGGAKGGAAAPATGGSASAAAPAASKPAASPPGSGAKPGSAG